MKHLKLKIQWNGALFNKKIMKHEQLYNKQKYINYIYIIFLVN